MTADAHRQGRLFTIGIPVYNGRSLLRNCLDSVVHSTFPHDRFEVVVADDGSSEPETLEILREFEEQLASDPGFFRVLRLESNSGGAARPRNRILDVAAGEYVFFVDSDDTIGAQALERIAEELATTPVDWVALHQVAVNGRLPGCVVPQRHVEVNRDTALQTLTVHKVFRRAEIERQRLRFDEGLPSGQDLAFAFSYLLRASRFLMLGGYDYYFITQHARNRNEPAHLSRLAREPEAVIEKNERILRSMITALVTSDLPEPERQQILAKRALPRVLIEGDYLKAIISVRAEQGTRALRRLSELLAGVPIADVGPDGLKGLTREHLAVIARADWPALVRLVRATLSRRERWGMLARGWARRARPLVNTVTARR